MSDFHDVRKLPEAIGLIMADNCSKVFITHVGTVLLKHTNKDNVTQITKLEPVYYQAHSSHRLLSQGAILRRGYYAYADTDHTSLRLKSNDKVFMTCYPMSTSDNLHWLKSNIVKNGKDVLRGLVPKDFLIPKRKAMIAHNTVDYNVWHRRLGHPSKDVLSHAPKVIKDFPKIEIPKTDKEICSGCAKGKMTQHTFPANEKRAKELFELVHMDIMEFPTFSYHKYKYVLNILDDHSSFGAGFLMAHRDGIFEAFKEFYIQVEVQDKIKIKQIRVDNEFVTGAFRQFCREKGIILGPTAPYEHQQNGRIERFNRTIQEKAESMRHMACLPPSWWEFSVQATYVVYNRTPMRRRWNKERNWETPYQLRYGKKPDVLMLRTFGCAAYVFRPKETRANKQAPRSELMIFIGYTEGMNAYKFMRTHNNSIATSSNGISI